MLVMIELTSFPVLHKTEPACHKLEQSWQSNLSYNIIYITSVFFRPILNQIHFENCGPLGLVRLWPCLSMLLMFHTYYYIFWYFHHLLWTDTYRTYVCSWSDDYLCVQACSVTRAVNHLWIPHTGFETLRLMKRSRSRYFWNCVRRRA